MTAKRFEVWKTIGSFQCWHIEDIINDKVVCDHIMHKYEADRLCSCLNELHEENMMLKGEVAHYKLLLMSLEKEAKRLSQIR